MEDLKQRTCCFTGHREIEFEQLAAVRTRLEEEIQRLHLFFEVTTFICGGATGLDTLAALAVIRLRKQYPDIRLQLALPCETQAARWPAADVAVYEAIKDQADEVLHLSARYTADCMYRRNRYMVDHSAYCVCYLQQNKGGTAYTVKYARKKGLQVIQV